MWRLAHTAETKTYYSAIYATNTNYGITNLVSQYRSSGADWLTTSIRQPLGLVLIDMIRWSDMTSVAPQVWKKKQRCCSQNISN